MICKDKDFIFATLKVMALSLKCLINSYKLLIWSLILSLYKNHFPYRTKLLDVIYPNLLELKESGVLLAT